MKINELHTKQDKRESQKNTDDTSQGIKPIRDWGFVSFQGIEEKTAPIWVRTKTQNQKTGSIIRASSLGSFKPGSSWIDLKDD